MAPTALVASLRLRPNLHRFDLSLYLLQCWLYNKHIDSESIKWSLSIIVQICGVPTFLGLHSNLLSLPGNYTWWAVQYGLFLPHDAMLSVVYAAVVCRQDLY